MDTADFEEAFGNFPERQEYDALEGLLFSLVRAAFRAGWEAAGGVCPQPQPIVRLLEREDGDPR